MKALAAAALLILPNVAFAERVDDIAARYKLAGEVFIARGDRVVLDKAYGTVRPDGGTKHETGARWRLASITKQITAALVVKALQQQGVSLDLEIASLDFWNEPVTTRQLLTHHSGLANPDQTAISASGVPSFYLSTTPDLKYCWSKKPQPGADFAYNNCDYIVAATLWGVGVKSGARAAWPEGMTMSRPSETGVPGFVGDKPEPHYELASFGAAGGLIGTARDVFRFDRSLMTGKFLSPATPAELWKPEGHGSYQALGQWVFPGSLKGCAKPKRIVQRDGEIGGVQTRNYILPDDDLVVVVFTNRSSDDFAIGEVWQGKGFAYDLLSAAACP